MFKFGKKEVTTKDFYGQRQMTDIFTIDVNKLVVSDKVLCCNGKDCRYIVRYQVDEALIPLFMKTPKNIFSYGVLQFDKNFTYTMSFNVSEEKEWMSQDKKIWNDVGSQLFEKLAMEQIKWDYVHGELKKWKKDITTNFHGQIVPYDVYCNGKAMLMIDSVYKEGKNYHPETCSKVDGRYGEETCMGETSKKYCDGW